MNHGYSFQEAIRYDEAGSRQHDRPHLQHHWKYAKRKHEATHDHHDCFSSNVVFGRLYVFLSLCFLILADDCLADFGMNFEEFPGVKGHSDKFFWQIAGPVIVVTLIGCLREVVGRGIVRKFQRRAVTIAGKRRRGLKHD